MKILYDYEIMIMQKIGGVSRYHYELAKRISRNNEVRVPVLFSQNYYFKYFFHKKIFKYSNRYLKWILRKINAIYTFCIISNAYLKGKPYDIIHSTFYNPDYIYLYYKILDKTHKTKYIITIHDMIQEFEANKFPNMKRSAKSKKKALLVADGIISVSKQTQKDLINIYPFVSINKIKTIYLGCNKKQNIKSNTKFSRIRNRYILFVGQRNARKNFYIVLLAMKKIHKLIPDIHLQCAGGSTFNSTELSKINELGLKDFVHQAFFKDEELYNLYANAECLIYPSLYEGFGLPILEAWSQNCPVLLSHSSCFPEIGGDAALYFNGKSEDEIVKQFLTLLSSTTLREELIQKGRKRLKMFSWDKMSQKTLDWYKTIYNNMP